MESFKNWKIACQLQSEELLTEVSKVTLFPSLNDTKSRLNRIYTLLHRALGHKFSIPDKDVHYVSMQNLLPNYLVSYFIEVDHVDYLEIAEKCINHILVRVINETLNNVQITEEFDYRVANFDLAYSYINSFYNLFSVNPSSNHHSISSTILETINEWYLSINGSCEAYTLVSYEEMLEIHRNKLTLNPLDNVDNFRN